MTIFDRKLKELLEDKKFWNVFLAKFIWNLSSTRVLVFITVIIFFALNKMDQWAFLAGIGIFVTGRTLDKFRKGDNE